MASGSLKDLSKEIIAILTASQTPAIPDRLRDLIDAFLLKHKGHDDTCINSLQDELLSIYRKLAEPVPVRVPVLLAIVIALAPHLRTTARLAPWIDVGRVLVESFARNGILVDDCESRILDILVLGEPQLCEDGLEGRLNPLIQRLASLWVVDYFNSLVGNHCRYYEKALRNTMTQYGRKRPKSFFLVADGLLLKRASRKAALSLIAEMVEVQSPHLHVIVETPLFLNLLRCLQLDTSTTIVSSALTVLIMLIPNMAAFLVPNLPVLFNIYTRLLLWDRVGSASSVASTEDSAAQDNSDWELCTYAVEQDSMQLPRVAHYFTMLYGLYPINFIDYIRNPQRYPRQYHALPYHEVDFAAAEIQQQSELFRRCHLLHRNFFSLTIESERSDFDRWMKSEPADIATECFALCLSSELDGGEVDGGAPRLVSETAVHLTAEREPSLRTSSSVALLSDGDGEQVDQISTVSGPTWQNAQSATTSRIQTNAIWQAARLGNLSMQDRAGDSPTSTAGSDDIVALSHAQPPLNRKTQIQPQLEDMIYSNKLYKLAVHQNPPNYSAPSLSLKHRDSAGDAMANQTSHSDYLAPPEEAITQVVLLQRQLNLVQNDLRFERYLRQQHALHIGSLRRRQMADIAGETETQNLLSTNRHLKNRVVEAKKTELQIRRESEKFRLLCMKRQEDFYGRLRASREEAKKARVDSDKARYEADEALKECARLKMLEQRSEQRRLEYQQAAQVNEANSRNSEHAKAESGRLVTAELELNATEARRIEAEARAAEEERRVAVLQMRLDARERDFNRMRDDLQGQVSMLRLQLLETEEDRCGWARTRGPGTGRATAVSTTASPTGSEYGSVVATAILERSLTAGRARYADLQYKYNLLMRKYTGLHSALLDMRSVTVPGRPIKTEVSTPQNASGYTALPSSIAPLVTESYSSARSTTGFNRAMSDSDIMDAMS